MSTSRVCEPYLGAGVGTITGRDSASIEQGENIDTREPIGCSSHVEKWKVL